MSKLLDQIQSNIDSINEGFLKSRNLNILNNVPKTVKLSDISESRVLLMKFYSIAIKSESKHTENPLELSSPVELGSDSAEKIVDNYNQDHFGFKIVTAVMKRPDVFIKAITTKISKKIADEYISNAKVHDIELHTSKNKATIKVSNDDFEDGPSFEVEFKLSGSTIRITETMKF